LLGALSLLKSSAGGDGLDEGLNDLGYLGGRVVVAQLVDYDEDGDGCDGCNDGGNGELEVDAKLLFLLGEVGYVQNFIGHDVLPFFEGGFIICHAIPARHINASNL